MSRVVMVLADGLGDEPARSRMGYLEHLVEEAAATRYTSRAVIPTNSRPNYESLHTGLVPLRHGKTSNLTQGMSSHPNVFSLANGAGLTTAVVGYHWFSELYHSSPFDPIDHVEYDHAAGGINFGRFYQADDQPASEVVARGVMLARRHLPDYMLVHPMSIDHAGHQHGGGSTEYSQAVSNLDGLLAVAVPIWLELGYSVIVTADHGHDGHRYHGGTEDVVRKVPLYAIPADGLGRGVQSAVLNHLQVAPTICATLGLEVPETMEAKPFDW